MTIIDKKYGSDEEESSLTNEQILNALKASNRIDAHIATNMAKLNSNFSESKRQIGASHQHMEDVVVDQATRVMHHINEEVRRTFKEALAEYFEKVGGGYDMIKSIADAVKEDVALLNAPLPDGLLTPLALLHNQELHTADFLLSSLSDSLQDCTGMLSAPGASDSKDCCALCSPSRSSSGAGAK